MRLRPRPTRRLRVLGRLRRLRRPRPRRRWSTAQPWPTSRAQCCSIAVRTGPRPPRSMRSAAAYGRGRRLGAADRCAQSPARPRRLTQRPLEDPDGSAGERRGATGGSSSGDAWKHGGRKRVRRRRRPVDDRWTRTGHAWLEKHGHLEIRSSGKWARWESRAHLLLEVERPGRGGGRGGGRGARSLAGSCQPSPHLNLSPCRKNAAFENWSSSLSPLHHDVPRQPAHARSMSPDHEASRQEATPAEPPPSEKTSIEAVAPSRSEDATAAEDKQPQQQQQRGRKRADMGRSERKCVLRHYSPLPSPLTVRGAG